MAETQKPTRKQLEVAMEEAFKRFGGRDDVTGADIGYRWTDGKPTKEVCVRGHVREKIPTSALEAAAVFPEYEIGHVSGPRRPLVNWRCIRQWRGSAGPRLKRPDHCLSQV